MDQPDRPDVPAAPTRPRLLPLGAALLMTSLGASAQVSAPDAATNTSPVLQPVVVRDAAERNTGYQSGTVSVGRLPQAAKDIPQSLTVVTEGLMHDQGKDTVRQALENVVGITFEAGEGGRIGDNVRLRGFSVSGDIYRDGLRDIAQYNRDTFNLDRIEVLRGSASMLFGRGSTGGVINQVTKLPRPLDTHQVDVTVGNQNHLRTQGDFNFKTGDDAAVRINLMAQEGGGRYGPETGGDTHKRGLGLAWTVGMGTANEFTLAYDQLAYREKPDFGFPWLGNSPAPAPTGRRWYGLVSDVQQDGARNLSLTHTHRFADGSVLKTTLRDGRYDRDLWATTAGLAAGVTAASFGLASPVTRGSQTRAGQEHHRFVQSDFSTRRDWAGLRHELLAGFEYADERSVRFAYTGVPAKPATTVDSPSTAAVADTRVKTWANSFAATTLGVYAQDIVTLAPRWKVLGGVRHDRFSGDYDRATGGPLSRRDALWSWRTAVMFQPDDASTFYLARSTSFNTSGDLYQYDPTTANTPPESSRNTELGVKWELWDGDLSLRAAVSRTEKRNERSTDTETVPGGAAYLLNGRRHTDALEFEFAGRLNAAWQVFGGVALTRARVDEAGSSPAAQATVGENPGLTPARQANLWTTWTVAPRWRLGGGLLHVSENKPAAAEASLARVPAYTRYDAMLEHELGRGQTLKLNIENLTDRLYYSSLYRGFVVAGAPRTVRLTWTARF